MSPKEISTNLLLPRALGLSKPTQRAIWRLRGRYTLSQLTCALLFACAPAFLPTVTLSDATHDDYGPGSYKYPADRVHAPGSYDLTEVRLGANAQEVIVQVDIRGWFGSKEGQDAGRYNTTRGLPPNARANEDSGFHLQNIEIYIDTDANPNTGSHQTLPGRKATLTSGWEQAIWLSPTPLRARTELARRDPTQAAHVIIPTQLFAKNHTLEARFSRKEMPAQPSKDWLYTVLLSGAVSEDAFGGKENFFIRPVSMVADESTFTGGGAPILDVWVPVGATPTQEALLQNKTPTLPGRSGIGVVINTPKSASQAPSSLATLPPNSQPSSNTSSLATIIDAKGAIISLQTPAGGLRVGQLGELVSRPGVYVIVTDVLGELCLARLVQAEAAQDIVIGGKLRF
jgi:hypothetical protein